MRGRFQVCIRERDQLPDDPIESPHRSDLCPAQLTGTNCQGPARARGELVRCVLESLALEYALSLENLGRLSGRPRKALYMVGGGIANTLLCQLTADACNVPVYAGADQCTALGNALCQAMALGILSGPAEIREAK